MWVDISSRCSREELGLVAVTCCAIWMDRNKIVHDEPIPSAIVRSQWIVEYLRIFVDAKLSRWEHPKINCLPF